MKKILREDNPDFIQLGALSGNEMAAYATRNKYRDNELTGYCILSRLENGNFGFINLTRVGTAPSFVGKNHAESIAKASKKRDVLVFENYEEMLTKILNKEF